MKTNQKFCSGLLVSLFIIILGLIYVNSNYYNKQHFTPINKKIFILYTGGNIGMIKTPTGYQHHKGLLETELKNLTQNNSRISNYDIYEYNILSNSEINPLDWNNIAIQINKIYDQYDAFIIISDVDTIPYTATSLSFLLETLTKTVIITGSNTGIMEKVGDGRNSLLASLYIATNYQIPEVIIVHNNNILRGCRSTIVNNNIITPHYPPLGIIKDIVPHINDKWLLKFPKEKRVVLRLINFEKYKIVILKLFPGITEEYLLKYVEGANAIILENSDITPQINNFVETLVNKGVIIVDTSQKHNIQGVIKSGDMTVESAFVKLYFLLSNLTDLNIIYQLMSKNMRGEVSVLT